MKYFQLISLLLLFTSETLFSLDNAYIIEKGKRQMGVFQPIVFGIKNDVEISIHPILFLIKPNIRLKKFYREINGLSLASRYSFDYPTLLLKFLHRDGIGGFLANDPDIGEIPTLIVLQSEWILTKKMIRYSLTGKVGLSTCLGCELDRRHLIDYDLVYPRMALYYYGIGANIGLDWDYIYSEKISLKVDVDLLFLPEEHTFIEHKLLFHYAFSNKYTLSSGYKFCYGYYPFSKKQGLWNLFPLFDLSWQW